jgi:hypothetical protein
MARIFISHSSANSAEAIALRDWAKAGTTFSSISTPNAVLLPVSAAISQVFVMILGQRRAPDGSQVVFAAIGGAASAWYRARMVGLAKCDSAAPGLSPESRRSGALAQAANVSSFSSVVGLLCYNKRVALASRGRSELAP